jgi:nitroimidazol reductase NimA-like FMN-containing flavoprotein (pyridoxamine 5'-phosphate oxidase superfamily)
MRYTLNDPAVVEIVQQVEYGTLALSDGDIPYSLPINFAVWDGAVYFHGSRKGRKIDALMHNPYASFSVVTPFSLIDSDFSSRDGLACPTTQFFASVIIDGQIAWVDARTEKIAALNALMQKLQPKGAYAPLDDPAYTKAIEATTLYKLTPTRIGLKEKFGQRLPEERFEMIIENLAKRNTPIDRKTIEKMHIKRIRNGL